MSAGSAGSTIDASAAQALLEPLTDLVARASAAILAITRITAEDKPDGSPVTQADLAADAIIVDGLRHLRPDIPVLSEERVDGAAGPYRQSFFIVDPLDGTREFISRRPDFTVNIALVRNGVPEIGVVYAPARGEMHSGYPGHAEAISVGHGYVVESRRRVHVREAGAPLAIVASRSHSTPETDNYIRRFAAAELVSVGSSLKFCLIACGKADLYPRFGRTMEWDTAAGDAVLRAAGGITTTLDGAPLAYGKRNQAHDADFANPYFVAKGLVEGC
jgi:3'(2'), 5'-bisphosphate nucleotidase